MIPFKTAENLERVDLVLRETRMVSVTGGGNRQCASTSSTDDSGQRPSHTGAAGSACGSASEYRDARISSGWILL